MRLPRGGGVAPWLSVKGVGRKRCVGTDWEERECGGGGGGAPVDAVRRWALAVDGRGKGMRSG